MEESREVADLDASMPEDSNGTDETHGEAIAADTSVGTTNGEPEKPNAAADADGDDAEMENADEEEEYIDANATEADDAAAADESTKAEDEQSVEAGTSAAAAEASPAVPNEVDLDQCRVCLSKSDLVNIFSLGEHNMRICDVIMTVCRVKILERDHLPNFLCLQCVDKVNGAMQFKTECENTDKELRSKLKRSKKTAIRRSRGDFVLVDCELDSSSEDDENDATGEQSPEKKARGGKRRGDDDDDEFQISDGEAEDASVAESSDSSYVDKVKVKPVAPKRRGRPPKSAQKQQPTSMVKSPGKRGPKPKPKHDVVYVDAAPAISDGDSDDDDDEVLASPPKRRGRPPKNAASKSISKVSSSLKTPTSQIPHKKRALRHHDDDEEDDDDGRNNGRDSDEDYTIKEKKTPGSSRKGHPCPFCDEVFSSYEKLREHKKKYIGQKPLECKICGKAFKQRVSYDSHVQRHKENGGSPGTPAGNLCSVCKQSFQSRIELRRHEQSVHDISYPCKKCKRTFTSKGRLDRHLEHTCLGIKPSGGSAASTPNTSNASAKRVKHNESTASAVTPIGKDLFRCVAPLTSTYWSDSFSD